MRRDRLGPVLVTDGYFRKSLAAVRALGREGVRVVAAESTPFAPALFSRYAWRRALLPPVSRRAAFVAGLSAAVLRHGVRTLLPMEEATLLAVLEARERGDLPGEAELAVPFAPRPVIERLRDKAYVMERARALGIETPRTWILEGPEAAEGAAHGLPYPLVVKPRDASGARGIRYVARAEDLAAAYRAVAERFPRPLVQERIPSDGPGVGVSLLYDRERRLVARFTHRRLREYPADGGASTLRVSDRAPDAERASEALLEAEGFLGPAMVEWKRDPRDGRLKLLEVNPRFWGSLALAVACGVNFPLLLARMARGERCAPVTTYPIGVRVRWLLPGDLLHFASRRDWRGLIESFGPGADRDEMVEGEDFLPAAGGLLSALPLLYHEEFARFRALSRA